MKLYWTLASIPELTPLSEGQRKDIWRICYKDAVQRWRTWLSINLPVGLFTGLIMYMIIFHIGPIRDWFFSGNSDTFWIHLLGIALIGGFSAGAATLLYRPIIYQQMRPFLRTHVETMKSD